MLIVIDYDETYTEAPVVWGGLIRAAQEHGHTVVCCTMRPADDWYNQDVIFDMGQYNVPIVYAAEHQDKWEAMQKAGYVPENAIWIDDRPMYIFMNREKHELPD